MTCLPLKFQQKGFYFIMYSRNEAFFSETGQIRNKKPKGFLNKLLNYIQSWVERSPDTFTLSECLSNAFSCNQTIAMVWLQEDLILMKEMVKKCSIDQRIIFKDLILWFRWNDRGWISAFTINLNKNLFYHHLLKLSLLFSIGGFICDNSTGLIRHKRGRFCQNGHLQRRKRDREK